MLIIVFPYDTPPPQPRKGLFVFILKKILCVQNQTLPRVSYQSLSPPSPSSDSFSSLAQVSPAKFAWIVHSVGVLLASMSPISSWVGLQIGYTNAVLDALGLSPTLDGFLVVLRSLPFRFFPLFYLLLILVVLVSGRDFGPMAASEGGSAAGEGGAHQRTAVNSSGEDSEGGGGVSGGDNSGGGIKPKAGTPLRSFNALVPFGAVIAVTVAGMILDGIGTIEEGGNKVLYSY